MGNRQEQRILLVGGGLANALLAYRLRLTRPDVAFTVFEKTMRLGGEHTWSFHESDLAPSQNKWLSPLVYKRWPSYRVKFPAYERVLGSPYGSIRSGVTVPTSQDFHHRLMEDLREYCLFGQGIRHVSPQHIVTDDGVTHQGALVVDGRGFELKPHGQLPASPHPHSLPDLCGYQKFTGLILQVGAPHGITDPVVMDARLDQTEGFRFVYILPWDDHQLLVEDTYYSHDPHLDPEVLKNRVLTYVSQTLGIPGPLKILHQENGNLPIPMRGFQQPSSPEGIVPSGMGGGLFHPTTSYSLGPAAAFSDFFTNHWHPDQKAPFIHQTKIYQKRHWQRGSFFRRLNNMLFLAATPSQRVQIFQQFYQRPLSLIERFYRGQISAMDKITLLTGRPPIPIKPAMRAFIRNPSTREVDHHAR